jgi:hypothetical protein
VEAVSLHFYEVDGLLIRRWVPAGRRKGLEFWNGDAWDRYQDEDHLLRYGSRLSEAQAFELLQQTRNGQKGLAPLSEEEVRTALAARARRA